MNHLEKHHRFPLRVYYADTDAGGVVYHSRYIEFFERARYELFDSKDLSIDSLVKEGYIFAIKNINITYIKPALLGEWVTVVTNVVEIGKASAKLSQILVRDHDGEKLCEADVTAVCIGKDWKPRRIPTKILDCF